MEHPIKQSVQSSIWINVTDSLVLILITAATILLTKWLWDRRKFYYYSWHIKGPRSFPLIGTLHRFAVGSTTSDIINTIIDIQRESPDLTTFWYGTRLLYLVSKPEIIEKVLTSPTCLNKDPLYGFIRNCIGDGLMTSPDHKWKKNRKLIAPSFNYKIVDSFVEIFERQAIILGDQLAKHIGETNFDIFHVVSNCTADILCETTMGVETHNQTSDCELATKTDRMMELVALRIFHVLYQPEWLWNLLPESKEFYDAIRVYRGFCDEVIKKKMVAYEQKMNDKNSGLNADVEEKTTKVKAFLDLLLEYGTFNEEQLTEEVNIFIIAGTDTTATALTTIFMCLGMFPDIQERVYQEIISIMGHDRSINPSDLPQLKYMDLVIKEALRLFPSAPFFLRQIGEDLDVGDTVLPKGSSAFFGPIHLHRHPGYWEDPLKFDPDRFLPENVAKRHPCTYIPFSYGSRNCIGMRYANTNMKTVLSTILRRYRLTSKYKSIEEVTMSSNIILRFTHGTQLTIHER